MTRIWIGLFAAVLMGLIAVKVLPAQISTDGAHQLPALVVKDADGTVVGQVVSFDGWFPQMLLKEASNFVLVRASRTSLTGRHRVYYANNDCTGQAYLEDFTTTCSGCSIGDSFDEMQGVAYAVGKPFGAGTVGVLYRQSATDFVPTTLSEWIGTNPPASRCFQRTQTSVNRRLATTVVDLDTIFTGPFSVE